MIIDNIATDSGLSLAKRIGFEVVRSYKAEATVRLTKEAFLNFNKENTKKVTFILYNNMDLYTYSIIKEVLSLANQINGKEMFLIRDYNLTDKINIDNGISIQSNNCIKEIGGDIIIIPGGMVDDELKFDLLNKIGQGYFDWEYVCLCNSAIHFFKDTNVLEGIILPKCEYTEKINSDNENYRIMNRNFVDNGKIMLVGNMSGAIELAIILVKKIGGNRLSDQVCSHLGFTSKESF